MFDYTRVAVEKIVEDLKKNIRRFSVGMQVFMIAYLVCAVVFKIFDIATVGNFYANVVLLVLSVAYLIFDLVFAKRLLEGSRLAKKITERTIKWGKLLTKGYVLGITIYGIYTATKATNPIAVILATLMIITFTLQVLFEIITSIIVDKKDLLFDAWKQDIEDIKRPATEVGNFFKRITGQEVEERPKPNGNIRMLGKRIEAKKQAKKEEKERLKAERKESKKSKRKVTVTDLPLDEVSATEDTAKTKKKNRKGEV